MLRKRIGYRGMILSDDLEMGGILKFLPVDEAAVEAIRAGSDLVEICHSAELILRTYEALLTAAEKSQHSATCCSPARANPHASAPGSTRARFRRPLPAKQFDKLRADVSRFRDAVIRRRRPSPMPSLRAPRLPAETS